MPAALPNANRQRLSPERHEARLTSVLVPLQAVLKWMAFLLATAWAGGAVYFDGPSRPGEGNGWLALAWLAVALSCLIFIRVSWTRGTGWTVCFLVVLVPWLCIKPSNDRGWKPN